MDYIFVQFDGWMFQQIIGIPMGINCAPLLADLFLHTYEANFLQGLLKNCYLIKPRNHLLLKCWPQGIRPSRLALNKYFAIAESDKFSRCKWNIYLFKKTNRYMIIKHFASEVFSVCFIIEKSREKRKGDISCSSINRWLYNESYKCLVWSQKRSEKLDRFQMIVNAFAKRFKMYQSCVGYLRLGIFIKRK